MKHTILILIGGVGLVGNLIFITGILTSYIYFIRHRDEIVHDKGSFELNPQKQIRMGDDVDSIDMVLFSTNEKV
jgi:hypothetical protein